MRSLSTSARASAFAQQTDQAWLVLLIVDHPDFADPLRFVNSIDPVVSNGEDFVPFPFEIEWPNDDPERAPEARLRIDNITRDIVIAVRDLQSPPTARFQVVLSDAPDVVEMDVTGYTLRNAEWDASTVTFTLKAEDLVTEPISLVMTPARFPALF